jgi:arylsulfatase A-like enzyme
VSNPSRPTAGSTLASRAATALAVAWAFAGPAAAEPAAKSGQKVDSVVLITIDTLRADHVSAYGGPVPTPAIDKLASQGALLETAYTPTPSTGPAHASLLTGLHVWHHGAAHNASPIDPRLPTVADAMKASGRATAAFVSSYILHRRFGFNQGFDTYVFEPSEPYVWRNKARKRFWTRGEETTRAANRWLASHGNEPFFLWVHYFDPHWPYQPPVGYAVSPKDPVNMKGKRVPKDQKVRDRKHLKALNRAYRGEVAYVDAQVSALLERMRMLALEERTAVILTSDHGEGLGDHAVMEHGLHLYEELIRIPLIVRAPGIPAGRRLKGAVQLEDLAPTLLAFVDLPAPPNQDGVNLLPWLRGEESKSPRSLVVGTRAPNKGTKQLYYVRDGSRKWIGARERKGITFDLANDPRERKPEAGNGMPESLTVIVNDTGTIAEGGGEMDPEVREALEALGYLED